MRTYTKERLIKALIEIRDRGWIPTQRKNNDGGIGNTLEALLGIQENNLPIPNASEWELKAQKKDTSSLITLFHMEPSPRAYHFVSSILLPEFGWKHREAGKKYPLHEKSFRQTIHALEFSNRGFIVRVDRHERKILIEFDPGKISFHEHPEWRESVLNKRLDPIPYWGFDDLYHKAGTKLHNCFLVLAESKWFDRVLHFRYQDIYMLRRFDLNLLIDAIDSGLIYIDFDARSGHNHGTKFRIKRDALIQLYHEVVSY